MFYEPDLLNLYKNGRFCKSWLAATSPSIFRRNNSRNQVSKIQVYIICEEIMDVWNKNVSKLNSQFSLLFLISQLMFGTVRIYQQQVSFLYEEISTLMIRESSMIKLLKRKWNEDEEFDSKPVQKNKKQRLAPDNNIVCNDSVTMKEAGIIQSNEIPEVESFQQMSDKEQQEFRDLMENRKSIFDVFEENDSIFEEAETQLALSREKQMTVILRSQSNMYDSVNVAVFNIQKSLITLANNTNLSRNKKKSDRSESPLPLHEIALMKKLCEIADTSKNKNRQKEIWWPESSLIMENENEIMPTAKPMQEFKENECSRKRRKRNIHLICDKKWRISDKDFNDQIFNYRNTMRCKNPLEDIFSRWNQELKIDLFRFPATKICSTFQKSYNRNLKTRKRPNDDTIILEILGLPIINNKEDTPPLEQMEIQESIGTQNINDSNFISTDDSKLDKNRRKLAESVLLNVEVPVVEFEEDCLPKTHSEKIYYNDRLINHREWGSQAMFKKLVPLWVANQHPIQMNNLCKNGNKKKIAAIAFHSLLVLHQNQYISLKKKDDSLEIFHIEKGQKLIELLND